MHQQRRALGHPDLPVRLGRAPRPEGKDGPVEERRTTDRRDVEHPRVAQELVEVPAHRPGLGRVRGSEVDEQHALRSGVHQFSALGLVNANSAMRAWKVDPSGRTKV